MLQRPLSACAGTLVCVVALTACSTGPDLDHLRSEEIPTSQPGSTSEAGLPPEPSEDDLLSDRIEWGILRSTSVFARTHDPDATVECPEFDGTRSREVTCTVTFMGVEGEWLVQVEGSAFYYQSNSQPLERHLVRDLVEDMARYRMNTEHVLCDMDEVEVVEVSEDTDPIICEWAREESEEHEEGQGYLRLGATTVGMNTTAFELVEHELETEE